VLVSRRVETRRLSRRGAVSQREPESPSPLLTNEERFARARAETKKDLSLLCGEMQILQVIYKGFTDSLTPRDHGVNPYPRQLPMGRKHGGPHGTVSEMLHKRLGRPITSGYGAALSRFVVVRVFLLAVSSAQFITESSAISHVNQNSA